MNDKLMRTLTAIADAADYIMDVAKSDREYYFRFKGHAFSILSRAEEDEEYGRFSFHVYPRWTASCGELAARFEGAVDLEEMEWASYHSVHYEDEPFRKLYTICETSYLGVGRIFDDILRDSDD